MYGFDPTARGYQGQSANYLNQYGAAGNQLNSLGGQIQGAGSNMISQWQPRSNSMYGLASGIAAREPSWYADRAAVTSNQAFDESKGVQERTLARMGINPNSGRFAGLQTQWGLARAAAEAGAKTKAAQDAESTAFNRQAALLNTAQQGIGQGAGMLTQAGGMYDRAGRIMGDISGRYDRLATESQENATVKEGDNTVQDRWDEMLSQLQSPTMGMRDWQDPLSLQAQAYRNQNVNRGMSIL
jgi:hypothetical protein